MESGCDLRSAGVREEGFKRQDFVVTGCQRRLPAGCHPHTLSGATAVGVSVPAIAKRGTPHTSPEHVHTLFLAFTLTHTPSHGTE